MFLLFKVLPVVCCVYLFVLEFGSEFSFLVESSAESCFFMFKTYCALSGIWWPASVFFFFSEHKIKVSRA